MYIGKTIPQRPIPFEEFNPDFVADYVRENVLPTLEGRRKQICQNFIEHATAECNGDFEPLMASCSRKSQDYRRWGVGIDGKRDGEQPSSYEELEVFYGSLVAFNLYVIHFELEKFIVGEDALAMEGNVHQMYPASMLPVAFGITPEDDSEDAVYMLTLRISLFFIFDEDGLGSGEQSYTNGEPTAENFVKVPHEFVPQRFWDNRKKQQELMDADD